MSEIPTNAFLTPVVMCPGCEHIMEAEDADDSCGDLKNPKDIKCPECGREFQYFTVGPWDY